MVPIDISLSSQFQDRSPISGSGSTLATGGPRLGGWVGIQSGWGQKSPDDSGVWAPDELFASSGTPWWANRSAAGSGAAVTASKTTLLLAGLGLLVLAGIVVIFMRRH
jgi:hypothetical protein